MSNVYTYVDAEVVTSREGRVSRNPNQRNSKNRTPQSRPARGV